MTDREKYKMAFNVLHASGNISLEADMRKRKSNSYIKNIVLAAACIIIILSMGVTVYAYGEKILHHIFGWDNNVEITISENEAGQTGSVSVDTNELTEPVEARDDRLYFIVNGENTDITDEISTEKAYIYEYTDDKGYTHIWLVGLIDDDTRHYGYAEYIKDPDGEWCGGYSTGIETKDDGSTVPWFDKAKAEINCPW